MKLITEPLSKAHYRKDFDCGNTALDDYLKKQANQDIKKQLAVCFVYIEPIENIQYVKGYFTLSNFGISRELIPPGLSSKFPKSYQTIPTTLLGRLARDKKCTANRLGESLLMEALYRAYITSKKVASFAVVVDPIDENAKHFYSKYGFKLLPDSGKMFLPMATIAKSFKTT